MKPVLRSLPDYSVPTLNEGTRIQTDFKTIFIVLGAFGAGIIGWVTVRNDIADHTKQLTTMQQAIKSDHDLLTAVHTSQKEQKDLLEILVYGRKSSSGSRGNGLDSPEP